MNSTRRRSARWRSSARLPRCRRLPAAGILFACLLAGAAGAQEEEEKPLVPGQEAELPWPVAYGRLLVYVPVNYTAGRRWPAIFYYQGQGGDLDTARVRSWTGGRDVIVVSHGYAFSEARGRNAREQAERLAAEVKHFVDVRKFLSRRLSIDQDRVFMAGLSKGGWLVGRFAEHGLRHVAGAVILLAGRNRGNTTVAIDGLKGKPIYVGAGETDPNNVYARWAVLSYRRTGAAATWEEFAGLGHEVPARPELLGAWIDAVVRRPECQADSLVREWVVAAGPAAMRGEEPIDRYRGLQAIMAHPYFPLCSGRLRRQVEAAVDDLTGDRTVRAEVKARRDLSRTLRKEMLAGTLGECQVVIREYNRIVDAVPDSPLADVAERGSLRVEDQIEPALDRIRQRMPRSGAAIR